MKKNVLTEERIAQFRQHLMDEEKSEATIEKYVRDIRAFAAFAKGGQITKELMMAYKKTLIREGYAVRSINSMLASLNSFLSFFDLADCRVKNLRIQRQIYSPQEKELTKEEYFRLLEAARAKPRLHLILQTICSTGIRISELSYFTMEAVTTGEITVSCKSKTRKIFLPGRLRKQLLHYARKRSIRTGIIFRTCHGKAVNRSNIWAEMKALCCAAKVNPEKVFPHNLRKLFARTFYRCEKDIAKLADLLGHSSINTTRIYIMTTGMEHRRKLERLGLVV